MIKKIIFSEEIFPSLLKEIPLPPDKLFILGEDLSDRPHIAMVGTRKATQSGRRIARDLARELAKCGLVIVSGLAMGIDTAAHEGALEVGGKTVAVLANGLDTIYPRQNHQLAKRIISRGGSLVSEYEEGRPSFPNQFIERNRIISGLSKAILVIEAPKRSGALATARFALEQNRDVLAVPGPINHPNYVGSNNLIKDGAALITSAEDVLNLIGPGLKAGPGSTGNLFEVGVAPAGSFRGVDKENEDRLAYSNISNDEKKILEALRSLAHNATIEEISIASGLNAIVVSQTISFLVIKTLVIDHGGKYSL
jgi:DNA processing protein